MKHGKKYLEAKKRVDRNLLYEPREAISLAKELAFAGFDETVEMAVKLGVNPKHAEQQVRGAVVLPNGTGKEVKVLVFAKGEKAKEAEEAGADFVGAEEMVEKIEKGWMGFDLAISTPDMMKIVGKLGRILGPKGLMPNPKTGSVTFDIGKAVQEFKAGKVEYRNDKAGIIHVPIGKVSFTEEKLLENFYTVMDTLMKVRPAAAKGQYVKSVIVTTTMGPGIRVNNQKAASLGK